MTAPLQPTKPLAVAIMGPTASGKTALALAIARQIPSEIISVDSALVYRGMDIGTAKPGAEERKRVPHHLLDFVNGRAWMDGSGRVFDTNESAPLAEIHRAIAGEAECISNAGGLADV